MISTSFPRSPDDPSGGFVLGMARALARRGHLVDAIAPEPAGAHSWAGGAEWLDGIRIAAAPYARPRRLERLFFGAGAPDNLAGSPWLAALVPAAAASMIAAARRWSAGWDAVISHWLLPSALVAGAARRAGTFHLAVAHSSDVHLLGRIPLGRRLAALAIGASDAVGLSCEALGEELEEILGPGLAADCGAKLVPAPMGIDPASLSPRRPRAEVRRDLGIDGPAVLFLGRLVPVKGADALVDALPPGSQLVVAGDGPERAGLEARAERAGARAVFPGAVGPDLRADLLSACDVLALPSLELPDGRREGLPVVLLEAMAAGLPVVASRTGGVPEVVEDGRTGLLVPPGDAAALGAALSRILGDGALARRLAAAARKSAAARDWSILAERYERVLGLAPLPCGPDPGSPPISGSARRRGRRRTNLLELHQAGATTVR